MINPWGSPCRVYVGQGSKQMRETKDEAAKIDALKFPLW